MNIQACIFDLDGVIVDTPKHHYRSWHKAANSLGFDFSEAQNEELKGVSRMESLEIILSIGKKTLNQTEKIALAAKKNDWYQYFCINHPGFFIHSKMKFTPGTTLTYAVFPCLPLPLAIDF